jgi:hypothetical protein
VSGLGKRLDALEDAAEECRRRKQREVLRAEITRLYAVDGMMLPPHEIESKVAGALAVAEPMASLAASGLTLDQIARRMAVDHGLDPDRVLVIFNDLRARRGCSG